MKSENINDKLKQVQVNNSFVHEPMNCQNSWFFLNESFIKKTNKKKNQENSIKKVYVVSLHNGHEGPSNSLKNKQLLN